MTKAPTTQAAAQTEALEGLLDDVAARPGRAASVVVFDLDDTLFSTARRHLRILREYAAQRPHQEARELARLPAERLQYSITETARAAGLNDAALLEDLRAFWFERFFKNEYLLEDEPLPGAAEYCDAAAGRGGRVIYITGRDEAMREGTLRALARHGFPLPGEKVSLVLKPTFETPDLEFKREAVRRVAALGPVAGAFENEPAHVNLFREAFPESRLFLVETKHSGKPVEPHPSAHRIRDFRR